MRWKRIYSLFEKWYRFYLNFKYSKIKSPILFYKTHITNWSNVLETIFQRSLDKKYFDRYLSFSCRFDLSSRKNRTNWDDGWTSQNARKLHVDVASKDVYCKLTKKEFLNLLILHFLD